jgi:hypothetical protein
MRDFQNHPEWDLLQKLNESQKIFMYVVVGTKEEAEEYKRTTEDINIS